MRYSLGLRVTKTPLESSYVRLVCAFFLCYFFEEAKRIAEVTMRELLLEDLKKQAKTSVTDRLVPQLQRVRKETMTNQSKDKENDEDKDKE